MRLPSAPRFTSVRNLAVPLLSAALLSTVSWAEEGEDRGEEDGLPTVAELLEGLEPRTGLLDFYPDPASGKVWLHLPPPAGERDLVAEVIYVEGLTTGLGSNPIGLDRGQVGEARLLRIRRLGPRVLFELVIAARSEPKQMNVHSQRIADSLRSVPRLSAGMDSGYCVRCRVPVGRLR